MIDVLVDLQRGDCGKGKVSHWLNKVNKYGWIAKYNGGGNAGHATWIDKKKYVAHYLTSGIYGSGTNIVIGPGCVLNVEEFLDEVRKFDKEFQLSHRVFVHPYTNIITSDHIDRDDPDGKIGSTKKGIGPCYSDKYARFNRRADQVEKLKPFLLKNIHNWYNEVNNQEFTTGVLMEGSQGWWLDIDWGRYPYVTSSHVHPAFAFTTFGIPMRFLTEVYGVCKIYETYVGSQTDMVDINGEHEVERAIRKQGDEFGETTGRAREIGYLKIKDLVTAIRQTGVKELFINKCDVLEKVGVFKMFNYDGELVNAGSFSNLLVLLEYELNKYTDLTKIYYGFSGDATFDEYTEFRNSHIRRLKPQHI